MLLTSASAELTGIALQSLLFGAYLILSIGNAAVFANAVNRRRNPMIVVTNAVLFLLITSHWAIQMTRLFDAFSNSGYLDKAANTFFDNTNDPRFISKNVLYFAQTLMADSMMVYRLYIVWNRSWRVIVPSIVAIIVFFVSAIIETRRFSRPVSMDHDDTTTVSPWLVLLIFMTLFDTFYITGLITWRVWSLRRVLKQFTPRSSLGPVIQIVVESATLYTSTGIFYVVALLTRSPAQLIALDMISPMIGISFALITVRSNFRHRDDDYSMPPVSRSSRRDTEIEMGLASRNRSSNQSKLSCGLAMEDTVYDIGEGRGLNKLKE